MPVTLTRTASGKLVRRVASDATEPFVSAEWTPGTSYTGGQTVSGGDFQVSSVGATGTPSLVPFYFNSLATRSKVYVQILIELASASGLSLDQMGPAAIIAAGNGETGYTLDSFACLLTTVRSTPTDAAFLREIFTSDASSSAVTFATRLTGTSYRFGLFIDTGAANIAKGYDFGSAGTVTIAALTKVNGKSGRVGFFAGRSATYNVRQFYAATDHTVTVTGVPTGGSARVRSSVPAVLATASESGGTATIEMLGVSLADCVEVQVLDSGGTVIGQITPSTPTGVWPGDSYDTPPTAFTTSFAESLAPTESVTVAKGADTGFAEAIPASEHFLVAKGAATSFRESFALAEIATLPAIPTIVTLEPATWSVWVGVAYGADSDRPWQATRVLIDVAGGDFTSPVYDSGAVTDGEGRQAYPVLTFPLRGLAQNTAYDLQVAVQDAGNVWSDWTDPVRFTTLRVYGWGSALVARDESGNARHGEYCYQPGSPVNWKQTDSATGPDARVHFPYGDRDPAARFSAGTGAAGDQVTVLDADGLLTSTQAMQWVMDWTGTGEGYLLAYDPQAWSILPQPDGSIKLIIDGYGFRAFPTAGVRGWMWCHIQGGYTTDLGGHVTGTTLTLYVARADGTFQSYPMLGFADYGRPAPGPAEDRRLRVGGGSIDLAGPHYVGDAKDVALFSGPLDEAVLRDLAEATFLRADKLATMQAAEPLIFLRLSDPEGPQAPTVTETTLSPSSVELDGSAYASDDVGIQPAAGAVHAATRWESDVRSGGYSAPIDDTGDSTTPPLTTHAVTVLPNRRYRSRARYTDDFHIAGPWGEVLYTLGHPAVAVHGRILTQNALGSWVDLCALDGQSFVEAAQWESSIDAPVGQARVTLFRGVSGTKSLSPTLTASRFNREDFAGDTTAELGAYAPLIQEGRGLRIQLAVVDDGSAPEEGDWQTYFEGTIDGKDWAPGETYGGGKRIVVDARDLGCELLDRFIEDEKTYTSTDGTPLEEVIQTVLDDNLGAGEVTLYSEHGTDVTPFDPADSPGWAIRNWAAKQQSLLEALRSLALQIGYDLRYLRAPGTAPWRLTLINPDRAKTAADLTLAPSEYLRVGKLGTSRADVRNAVRVIYTNREGGSPAPGSTVLALAEGSIAKYGRRFAQIGEDDTSAIDTEAEATTMAEAARDDLSEPLADAEVELHLRPDVELRDLISFTADGQRFEADQKLAIVHYQHEMALDGSALKLRTTIQARGTVVGAYRDWLKRDSRTISVGGGTVTPPSLAVSVTFGGSDDSSITLWTTWSGAPAGTDHFRVTRTTDVGGSVVVSDPATSPREEIFTGTSTIGGDTENDVFYTVEAIDGSGAVLARGTSGIGLMVTSPF